MKAEEPMKTELLRCSVFGVLKCSVIESPKWFVFGVLKYSVVESPKWLG